MSGYLQRLVDRAGGGASVAPQVSAAGRLGAPMAEADQRLMDPGIEAGDLPLSGWFGAEPEAPQDDLFDRPVSVGQVAPFPEPPSPTNSSGRAPVAPRPVPAPELSRIERPPISESFMESRTANSQASTSLELDQQPHATVVPPQVQKTSGQLPLVPRLPDLAPVLFEAPPPPIAVDPAMGAVPEGLDPNLLGRSREAPPPPLAVDPAMDGAPEGLDPNLLGRSREAPPPQPATRTVERETVVEFYERVQAPPPITVAEPRPLRPFAEPAPELDLVDRPDPERSEPPPGERSREVVSTHTSERVEPAASPAFGAQSTTPLVHVTASSASVIGPLSDYQRAPTIRGRRRR